MSQTQTIFASAFLRAGFDIDAHRLATAAINALQRADLSPQKAFARFLEAVETDRALLRALVLDYLANRAEDMRGTSLTGEGQRAVVTQSENAPAGQPKDEDVGQAMNAEKANATLPASSSPEADCGGQSDTAASATLASPPRSAPIDPAEWGRAGNVIRMLKSAQIRDGGGPTIGEAQVSSAPSVAKPNPAPSLDKMRSVQSILAPSLLKTYLVRDGRPIGQVYWRELNSLALENETEARVLRAIQSYVANPKPDDRVADLISEKLLAEAIHGAAHAK